VRFEQPLDDGELVALEDDLEPLHGVENSSAHGEEFPAPGQPPVAALHGLTAYA
jgi:hypothetical protein